MADNILIRDADSTPVSVATRDKGGREVQLVQLDLGNSSTVVPAEGTLPVSSPALGDTTDAEATGNGSITAILKRIRTLLGSVLTVRGTRQNDGSDTAAGASHLTVGGSDGANLRPLLTDSAGRVVVSSTALGSQTDVEATGDGSITAILKRIRTVLGGILTVRGTRLNDGTDVVTGSTHLTVGGSDGTNLRPLLMDSAGRAVISSSALGASSDSSATSDTGTWSLVALTKRLLGKFTPVILPDGNAVMPVTGVMKKWVDDFGGSTLDATMWDVFDGGVYTGSSAGVGASGSGTAMGAPSVANSTLIVTMGTTPNAELHLLSKATFTIPVDVIVSAQVSQAIINNNVYFEIVEVDPATGMPVAHATLAGETRNRAGALLAGTTATTYTIEATCDDSPNGTNTVNATGGANWSTGAVDVNIEFRPQETWIGSVLTDTANTKSAQGRLSRQVPDPNKIYKLRLRFKNGGVAPASSTTVTLFRVMVLDVQEVAVEVTGGRGDAVSGRTISVAFASSGATSNQVQGPFGDNVAGNGNPVGMGGLMNSTAGGPTAGTAARNGLAQMDLARRQVVIGQGTPQSHVSARLAAQTVATEVTLLAAQGATLRSVLQTITIVNHDTAVLVLDIRDSSSGAIRETVRLAASTTMQLTFPNGRPAAALNTAWTVQARSATTTNGWDVAASFYVTTA